MNHRRRKTRDPKQQNEEGSNRHSYQGITTKSRHSARPVTDVRVYAMKLAVKSGGMSLSRSCMYVYVYVYVVVELGWMMFW
jgi:hypothetical protein